MRCKPWKCDKIDHNNMRFLNWVFWKYEFCWCYQLLRVIFLIREEIFNWFDYSHVKVYSFLPLKNTFQIQESLKFCFRSKGKLKWFLTKFPRFLNSYYEAQTASKIFWNQSTLSKNFSKSWKKLVPRFNTLTTSHKVGDTYINWKVGFLGFSGR